MAQRQSSVEKAQATIVQRESELALARKELERSQTLYDGNLIARQKLDEDLTRVETAVAGLAQERAGVRVADGALVEAQAQVQMADAALLQQQAQRESAAAALAAARIDVDYRDAAIAAAAARIERIRADIADSTLSAPIRGRVLYRLAEPGEVLSAGGKVVTVLELSDVYMTIFLPTEEAGRAVIGSEGRIVLDAAPSLVIPAAVSFVSPRAQFTPKEVETRTEREKLMFRVKVRIDPELLARNVEKVKTGLPGVAYVRLDAARRLARVPARQAHSMTGASPPVVHIRELSHRYGKVSAVDGLELDVPAGCLAGLIGPDGVGKSTLLGLIAGARKIRNGAVRGARRRHALDAASGAASRRGSPTCRRGWAAISTRRCRSSTTSISSAACSTSRRRERAAASTRCSPAPGSSPFRDRQAGKLSGGMKQKLGLCCALLHDPDFLILDEPTTGIDPLSRRQFWQLLARIRSRRPAMSVLVSTAYMEEAEILRLAGGHGRRAAPGQRHAARR